MNHKATSRSRGIVHGSLKMMNLFAKAQVLTKLAALTALFIPSIADTALEDFRQVICQDPTHIRFSFKIESRLRFT